MQSIDVNSERQTTGIANGLGMLRLANQEGVTRLIIASANLHRNYCSQSEVLFVAMVALGVGLLLRLRVATEIAWTDAGIGAGVCFVHLHFASARRNRITGWARGKTKRRERSVC